MLRHGVVERADQGSVARLASGRLGWILDAFEPEVWLQNRQLQRQHEREVHGDLGSGFVIYDSICALFATRLQERTLGRRWG